MSEIIEPALTAGEWQELRRDEGDDRNSFALVEDDDFPPPYLAVGPQGEDQGFLFPGAFPGIIALANHGLSDDDPRKITREWIAALDWAIDTGGDDAERRLLPIRNALDAYLPPEGA